MSCPYTMQPFVVVIVTMVGRSSASDTLRRMSSWWSQCPWGKPRPYGGSVVTVYHSTGGGSHCYRVAGRRAPVTAREVRAAAGTSALGVGGGPYGGLRIAPSSVTAFSGRATSCPRCGNRFSLPLVAKSGPLPCHSLASSAIPQGYWLHKPLVPRGVSLALAALRL